MYDIRGKVALVTGGAKGIGLAIAKELLQNDIKGIAILDINGKCGERVLEEINNEYGVGKAIFINSDVRNRNEFEDALKKTVAEFQNLDIVVNNAGIFNGYEWEKEVEVNLIGTANGTVLAFEHYLPLYKSSNEGIILNISSVMGVKVDMPHSPVYTATKSGVVALTRCFGQSVHYQRKNVKVIALCPHYTTTDILLLTERSFISPEYFKIHERSTSESPPVRQSPEHVGRAAVEIISKGENGSIWIVEKKNPPYEVEMYFSKK